MYEKLGSQRLLYSGVQGTDTLIVLRAFLDTDSCLSEVSVNSIAQVVLLYPLLFPLRPWVGI